MRRSNDPPFSHFPFGLFFSSFVFSSFLQYLYIANSNRPVGQSGNDDRERNKEKKSCAIASAEATAAAAVAARIAPDPIVFVDTVNADATRALLAES